MKKKNISEIIPKNVKEEFQNKNYFSITQKNLIFSINLIQKITNSMIFL